MKYVVITLSLFDFLFDFHYNFQPQQIVSLY